MDRTFASPATVLSAASRRRRGLTLFELVMVISISAMLFSWLSSHVYRLSRLSHNLSVAAVRHRGIASFRAQLHEDVRAAQSCDVAAERLQLNLPQSVVVYQLQKNDPASSGAIVVLRTAQPVTSSTETTDTKPDATIDAQPNVRREAYDLGRDTQVQFQMIEFHAPATGQAVRVRVDTSPTAAVHSIGAIPAKRYWDIRLPREAQTSTDESGGES